MRIRLIDAESFTVFLGGKIYRSVTASARYVRGRTAHIATRPRAAGAEWACHHPRKWLAIRSHRAASL